MNYLTSAKATKEGCNMRERGSNGKEKKTKKSENQEWLIKGLWEK